MDFGVLVFPQPDRCVDHARLAEAKGFSHVWVEDSPMMAGDVYLCLGLMARHTSRVTLGTGVAVVGTRSAPVAAQAIATLNQLAPGRVVLGLGTGNSARRAMGLPPCSLRELREYIAILRGLLSNREVTYQEGAETRRIKFFHQDYAFINTREPIPIYVAANAPRAMRLAGELGDGWLTSRTNTAEGFAAAWRQVSSGIEQAGKNADRVDRVLFTTACLLGPHEGLDSERVRAQAGPWATVALHSLYETLKEPEAAPAPLRSVFARYQAFMERRLQDKDAYYFDLHDGHCLYVREEEAQFVTPEVVQATTLTARPAALLERLRSLERAGVRQVTFIPTFDAFEEFVTTFGKQVLARW